MPADIFIGTPSFGYSDWTDENTPEKIDLGKDFLLVILGEASYNFVLLPKL